MVMMNSADIESYSFNQRLLNSEKNYKKMCFRKKPYQCSLCEKTFPTEIVLKEHKQTHKGGNFSCYRCGEVTLTLTKMVAHMRIHLIEEKPLSLGEQPGDVDSFIEIPDEFIEIEPLSVEVKDLTMMVESSTNQMPERDDIKFISIECNKKKANNFTKNIMNTQAEKEPLGIQNKNLNSEENKSIGFIKTVENEMIPCKASENIKVKVSSKNRLSTINRSKGTNRKKKNKVVEKLSTCVDRLLEEKKYDNEDVSPISNTTNILAGKSKVKRETVVNVLNENVVQNSKIEYNDPVDEKELGNSQVEFTNEVSNLNQDICQLSSKQENQDVLVIEESSQNTDQNVEKSKESDLNSVNSDKEKNKCDQCDYESRYRSNLYVHKKKHRPKELLKCQHCNFKSQYKGIMHRHLKRHIINESNTNKGNNNVHQGFVIKNKKKSEKNNNKKFSAKLKKCINMNENSDALVNMSLDNYKVCNEIKNSKNEKRKYVKKCKLSIKDKNPNKITFKCKNCDYKCLTKFRMKMHEQTHSNKRPFNCPHCEYSTKSKGTLKVHIRIHTGEKPYSCPECEYRCTTSTSLKKHVMIHSGEKPLKCSFCDYRCIQSNALKVHVKTHSDEKLFKCHQCNYSCKLQNSFQLHLDTHEETK